MLESKPRVSFLVSKGSVKPILNLNRVRAINNM